MRYNELLRVADISEQTGPVRARSIGIESSQAVETWLLSTA